MEDYQKTIYMLSNKGEVRGIDISKELGVSKATVSVSLKELEAEEYLYMTLERTVVLTDKGKKFAKDVLERNALFSELLLSLASIRKQLATL